MNSEFIFYTLLEHNLCICWGIFIHYCVYIKVRAGARTLGGVRWPKKKFDM